MWKNRKKSVSFLLDSIFFEIESLAPLPFSTQTFLWHRPNHHAGCYSFLDSHWFVLQLLSSARMKKNICSLGRSCNLHHCIEGNVYQNIICNQIATAQCLLRESFHIGFQIFHCHWRVQPNSGNVSLTSAQKNLILNKETKRFQSCTDPSSKFTYHIQARSTSDLRNSFKHKSESLHKYPQSQGNERLAHITSSVNFYNIIQVDTTLPQLQHNMIVLDPERSYTMMLYHFILKHGLNFRSSHEGHQFFCCACQQPTCNRQIIGICCRRYSL